MSVVVRMAPSPTGFLHIGGVHTFLFNWLFARGRGGECRLRIENTERAAKSRSPSTTSRISLEWLGLDWDGEVTFQLDRLERCQEEARRLVAEGRRTRTKERSASPCRKRVRQPGTTRSAAASSSPTSASTISSSSAPTAGRPTT